MGSADRQDAAPVLHTLQRERRAELLRLLACVVGPAALTAMVYGVKHRSFDVVEMPEPSPVADLARMEWRVEQHELKADGRYHIAGWVFEHDTQQPKWLQARVVLAAPAGSQQPGAISLRTNLVSRPDITAYVADGADYRHSGFRTEIDRRFVEAGPYSRVFLHLERGGHRFVVDTGIALTLQQSPAHV